MRKKKSKQLSLAGTGGTMLIVASFLGLYELATDVTGFLDKMLFPGLSKVVPALVNSLPRLGESFVSSMSLLVPGYFIGALSGMILGVCIALNPGLNKAMKPIIFALSPVPPSMLTPYLIAIMPTFYISSVGVIFLGCFWPYISGTINGITLIDQKYLDNAKILELRGMQKLFYVILPAAAPHILSGAGTALTFSFILLTVAEMFATDSGLGHFIQYYADFSDYARVLAGLFFTALVFVSIMLAYERIKKRILFWMLNTDSQG
ncbi:ABC transporter permease subunit [Desulfovibrio sp. OttesenSCG-928-G15]|nr:ABC transporter permease subunit [Desulfovibrio sp. OttesenSCG-928-G15]